MAQSKHILILTALVATAAMAAMAVAHPVQNPQAPLRLKNKFQSTPSVPDTALTGPSTYGFSAQPEVAVEQFASPEASPELDLTPEPDAAKIDPDKPEPVFETTDFMPISELKSEPADEPVTEPMVEPSTSHPSLILPVGWGQPEAPQSTVDAPQSIIDAPQPIIEVQRSVIENNLDFPAPSGGEFIAPALNPEPTATMMPELTVSPTPARSKPKVVVNQYVYEPAQTAVPTFESTSVPDFQPTTSTGFQSTQYGAFEPTWQAPLAATTPGHNEQVRMNRDLSLSPPPITGEAVREYLPNQPALGDASYLPQYDTSVGHRSPQPIKRPSTDPLDDGKKFSFEQKKRDFPPFGEIIATGRFFYNPEVMWAEPQFQGNTAIATEGVNFGQSIANDFDSDFHPRFRMGFESKYGPGMELTYFNINSNSEIASFTSDGAISGQTNAWVIGRNVWSRILADDAGEILTTQHSIDIDSFTVSFFKELKFPISRVNGNFGFQYVSIAQQLNANVVSGGGAVVETLQSTTDMRAFGPRAILEYYRPIGHTPLELVTTFGGSVLFGQRDQFVANSQTGLENRLGADEFLTILDFLVAVQYTKTVGENRSWYGRFGFMNQTWIGGGTAAFPQGDFGLRGLTFGIGYNR